MCRRLPLLVAALLTVAIAGAASAGFAAADDPPPKVPKHLLDRPASLHMRVGRTIADAPDELLALAKTYPAFADKGKVKFGKRITILADKQRVAVGERVRIIHVLEAPGPGIPVYVMGPKPVYDEYIDGVNVNPKPSDAAGVYDGKVLQSPAVDFNYDIVSYAFSKPGKYTIQWKGGGHPMEGDLGVESNVLTIEVVE
jgi:hypothetical protein